MIALLSIIHKVIIEHLDKKRITGAKTQKEIKEQFTKAVISNKTALFWQFSIFIGVFAWFFIVVWIFTTPDPNNPHIRNINLSLLIESLWLITAIQLMAIAHTLKVTFKVYKTESRKRHTSITWSILTGALYITFLIACREKDQRLIVVMFALCMGLNWAQFSYLKMKEALMKTHPELYK